MNQSSIDLADVALARAEHGLGPEARRLAGLAVRGGFILLAARLAMQGFVWGVTLTVARLLDARDYGVMTWGMMFLVLADLLAEAGVGKALIQKEDLQLADTATAFTLTLGLSAAFYAVLFVLAPVAGAYLAMPEFGPFMRVLGLLVLLIPFKTVPQAMLDRDLQLGRQAAVLVLGEVVQAGLVLGLALAGFGYWALASGAIVRRLLETVTLIWVSGWRPRLLWSAAAAGRLLTFGVHTSLGSLLWFVYSNCDFAVIGKVSGPEALGFYALAFQMISLPVQKLTANTNQIVYPVFCRLQGDRPRLRDWYLRLTVLLGFLGMPILAGLALVAEDAVAVVLGTRWLPAVLPLQMLSVVGILMVYSHSLPPLFNALGRPDINLRYTAVCTLLFPAAFYLGGKMGGLTGVCIAWLVLYPLMVAGLLLLTRRITRVGPLDLLRPQLPVVGAVLVMAAVVLAVRWYMRDAWPGLRLAASIASGAGAYAGVLLTLARGTVLADLRALVGELRGGKT